MTKTELNKFKEVLETKQAELAQVLRNREGITIEKSPDALDEVQNAAERELAIRNLDRESTCSARSARPCTASMRVRSEPACTAKRTLAPSGSTPYRGQPIAFRARKSPTATAKRT